MNELIDVRDSHATIRWKLLTSASALALTAAVSSATIARAQDADRPQLWIELGGQLERLNNSEELFAPSFFAHSRASILAPMVDAQSPPTYGLSTDGKITFVPEDSNWIFSLELRYGRANGGKHLHHEEAVSTATQVFPSKRNFLGDGLTNYRETHDTLDFQVGKDVGLGLFGSGSSSVIAAGVRMANFTSDPNIKLQGKPDVHNSTNFFQKYNFRNRHSISYTAILSGSRNTHAIGPSLSWNASVPLAGNGDHAALDFDWGINAAALFGRQKVQLHRRTSNYHYNISLSHYPVQYHTQSTQTSDRNRSRNVMIPNVGGFAGFSFRYDDAKISFGYRGDFFFGAMDGGIDTRKNETLGFNGPYASISVGLGD